MFVSVCVYINMYMKRVRKRYAQIYITKWAHFKSYMGLMLLFCHLSIQKKDLLWAGGTMFTIIVLSCIHPVPSPRWSLSKLILTVKCHYRLDLLLLYFNMHSNDVTAVISYYFLIYWFIWQCTCWHENFVSGICSYLLTECFCWLPGFLARI